MRLLRILGTLATRRRDYELLTQEVASSTNTDRQTILTPRNGFRIRLVRVTVHQHATDGRHLWELFYGSAGNMITAPNRGIDILAVPDQGSASTRTYLQNQGPRGDRNEVLSGRWRGTAPVNAHTIIIEYSEEP